MYSNLKSIYLVIFYSLIYGSIFSQNVEVVGSLKVSQMSKDNAVDSVVVRMNDGTLAVREVNSLKNDNHYIGELFGGGIIFYLSDNGEHGLIASLDDLDGGSGIAWFPGVNLDTDADDYYDGKTNTTLIVNAHGAGSYAAKLCDEYAHGGFADWYLPSSIELREMDSAILTMYTVLSSDNDASTNPLRPEYIAPLYGRYWSSSEANFNSGLAWTYYFIDGRSIPHGKNETYRVRAVRSF